MMLTENLTIHENIKNDGNVKYVAKYKFLNKF